MPSSRRQFVKDSLAVGLTVAGGASVSGWLSPTADAESTPLRPPGAKPEEDFTATCIRCLRCVDACPNRALVPLSSATHSRAAGTPTLQPRRAACMLCQDQDGDFLKCTAACPTGALDLIEKTPQAIRAQVDIGVAHIDLGLCYSYNNWSCGACYRACPLAGEAMTLGNWERPQIHPEACIGCGCCERSCIRYPHAIRVQPRVAS